jgi:hypothetical protein
MADKDLSALLAELGGDNPRNRVIAEGLSNQGIASIKDISVQKVPVPGHFEGTDEAAQWVPETTTNAYINKANNQPINPERIGIMQNGQYGLKGGDIFFHLNADQNGNVSFDPQWSPRAHGFLRDSPVGQAIMTLGKVIPSPLQPFFAAAGAADALAHGKYGQALASVVPYGLNELTQGTDLLTNLRGSDFNPLSSTSAGNIAEALGVPGQYADLAGKIGASELSNQLKGGPTGLGALTAGVGAGVQSGIGALGGLANGMSGFNYGVNPNDFDSAALGGGPTTTDTNAGAVNVAGTDTTDNLRAGDLGTTGGSLTSLTPAQLQALYEQENPGASSVDPETATSVRIDGKEYLLDNKGGASTQNADGTYTNLNASQFAALGEPDTDPTTNPLDTVTVTAKRDADTTGANNTTGGVNLTALPTTFRTLATSQIPVATSQIPVATSQIPVATSQIPVATSQIPVATSQIPVSTSQVAALSTGLSSLTSTQIGSLTSSQITGLITGAITPAIVGAIVGNTNTPPKGPGGYPTAQIPAASTSLTALTSTQVPAATTGSTVLTSNQIDALTTTEARGLQALGTSQDRYWRQTGAQGTGGKSGVRFFDWYDTPENRTMAPSTMAPASIPAITSQQAQAMTTPAPKQYFNQATNRYYTDTTGNWTPPAGWTQTGLKDGGEVKTKHYDGGGYADFDLGLDESLGNDWAQDLSYAPLGDLTGGADAAAATTAANEADAQNVQNINAANAASSSSGSVLDKLIKLAKDNPNLAKLLASAGIGAALGYAGRPKPVNPLGMQGGSLGLTQAQVHGALKGVPVKRAGGGGIGDLGGYAGGGGLHYLKSAEDGMADKIPATIDNKQPAKLSGGEFVIPADVVSHLGNGNSEAGAKQLYDMMDRIRHARTGNKQQGKQINPAKFTPK